MNDGLVDAMNPEIEIELPHDVNEISGSIEIMEHQTEIRDSPAL